MYPKLYYVVICTIFVFSCKTDPILDAHTLIERCVEAHGGIQQWKMMDTTKYVKNIVLYKDDGSIEKELDQVHFYHTMPSLQGSISWSDSLQREIIYENGKAYKINQGKKEAPSQSALNTFNSAYYVLNMPWKLMDESAVITYISVDTILNDRKVHTLQVVYPSEEKQDDWEYYLDYNEYFLVANKVHHGSTYSLITNDSFTEYKGLKFNAKRASYMVDSLGEVLYLRAKYLYSFEE
ncbi:MAG: DUF6503 family protein [Bacteroidota bacterium]